MSMKKQMFICLLLLVGTSTVLCTAGPHRHFSFLAAEAQPEENLHESRDFDFLPGQDENKISRVQVHPAPLAFFQAKAHRDSPPPLAAPTASGARVGQHGMGMPRAQNPGFLQLKQRGTAATSGTTPWHEYYKAEEMGRGGFGVVYKAFAKSDVEKLHPVAIKHVMTESKSASDAVRNEIKLLREVNEQQKRSSRVENEIVKLHRVYHASKENDEEEYFLVMDFFSGGDLWTRIDEGSNLMGAELLELALQMFHAIQDVHARDIIHRDVKPENFMFEKPHTSQIVSAAFGLKLIDFGIAIKKRDVKAQGSECTGTYFYWAPEVSKWCREMMFQRYEASSGARKREPYKFSVYTEKADIWSLGVTLWISAFGGKMPFAFDENVNECYEKKKQCNERETMTKFLNQYESDEKHEKLQYHLSEDKLSDLKTELNNYEPKLNEEVQKTAHELTKDVMVLVVDHLLIGDPEQRWSAAQVIEKLQQLRAGDNYIRLVQHRVGGTGIPYPLSRTAPGFDGGKSLSTAKKTVHGGKTLSSTASTAASTSGSPRSRA